MKSLTRLDMPSLAFLTLFPVYRFIQFISGGEIFRVNTDQNDAIVQRLNATKDEKDAKLLLKSTTSESQARVYIASHGQADHSYSFSVKSIRDKESFTICRSDSAKDFSIRSIDLDQKTDTLYLADAHNMAIWKLHLGEYQGDDKVCQLELWTRLPSQASHIKILDQPQKCISEWTSGKNKKISRKLAKLQ